MNVAQILALVSASATLIPLAEQTISAMIAEGRTSTTADETTALNDAVALQKSAEDQFEADRNG